MTGPVPQPATRYHAFDALRAAMMLFGVAMHAGLTYSSMPANPIWPVKDAHHSDAADWLFGTSGLFRMPAFFMMAGFFAGLLVAKRGEWRFLGNRARRLVVPFALGWALGFPVLRAAFAVAGGQPVGAAWASGRLWASPYPMHLWFLEYLLLYCAAGLLLAPLFDPLKDGFRWAARRGLLPVAGALVTVPLLALSPMASFGTPLSFRPDWVSLVAYGAFFAAGWGLYANADVLGRFKRWGWSALLAGVLCAPSLTDAGRPGGMPPPPAGMPFPVLGSAGAPPFGRPGAMPPPGPGFHGAPGADGAGPMPVPMGPPVFRATTRGFVERLPRAAGNAAVAWLLTCGLAGVFLMHLNHDSRIGRYVAGASYWVYLAHFPVLAWIGLALLPLDWPGDVKLVAASAICVLGLLVPYELVRRLRRSGAASEPAGVQSPAPDAAPGGTNPS